jgi:hypothetical protein
MRIKKGKEDASLKTFATIAARDLEMKIFGDGDLIKVTDASADPEISSGWAIYRYSKGEQTFDLIEKEEKEKELTFDHKTIFPMLTSVERMNVPELSNPFSEDIRILEDFDLSAVVNIASRRIEFRINGELEQIDIPIQTTDGIKYLALKGFDYLSSEIPSSRYGKDGFVHIAIKALIKNTRGESVSTMSHQTPTDGNPVVVIPRDSLSDGWVYIAQVRVDLPFMSHWAWDGQMTTVYKHWKRALIPAEQRVKPKLTIADFNAMPAFVENIKIMDDFDLTFKNTAINTLRVDIKFGDYRYKLTNKIRTPEGIKFIGVSGCNRAWDISNDVPRDVYFTVGTQIYDEADGYAKYLRFTEDVGATGFKVIQPANPVNFDTVPLAQVRVRNLGNGLGLDLDSIVVVKHFKQSVSHTLAPDNKTIARGGNGELLIPSLWNPIKNAYLLESFDFEAVQVEKGIQLKMVGGKRNIPIMTSLGIRWIGITEPTFSFKYGEAPEKGSTYRWGIMWKLSDDENTVPNGHQLSAGAGLTDQQAFGGGTDPKDRNPYFLQVSCVVPSNTASLTAKDFTIYKFWKNAPTAPVKAAKPDGQTVEIFTKDDKLRVIDGLQPCPHDTLICEDFDLKVQWSGAVKQIKFMVDNNEYLTIPCLQGATEKTMAINGFNQSIKSWGGWLFNSVYYGALVSKMSTDETRAHRMIHGLGKFPDLSGIAADEILVAIVRLPIPESFEAVDPTKLTYFRLWKKGLKAIKSGAAEMNMGVITAVDYGDMNAKKPALFNGQIVKCTDASADSEVSSGWAYYRFSKSENNFELVSKEKGAAEKWGLDNTTIFETTLWEKQVLFTPALLQTHRANFKILEDFDLKFSVGETYTSKKTFLLVQAMGGARNIPVMIGGVRKYMSVQDEHVLMPDLWGSSFGDKWKYFALRATISDTDGDIKYLNTTYEFSGEPIFVQPYPDDTKFLFVQIGVKFNADMKTIDDMENIRIWKYWKKALAPFNDLYAEMIKP